MEQLTIKTCKVCNKCNGDILNYYCPTCYGLEIINNVSLNNEASQFTLLRIDIKNYTQDLIGLVMGLICFITIVGFNEPLIIFLGLLPLLIITLISIISLKSYRHIKYRIGNQIRSYNDLALIKQFININMMSAIIILIMPLIIMFSALLSMKLACIAIVSYTLSLLASILVFPRTEHYIRQLDINANDPTIAEIYKLWLKQWRELRFQLPEKYKIH